MRILKSILAGFVAMLLALVLIAAIPAALILWDLLPSLWHGGSSGSAGIGAVSIGVGGPGAWSLIAAVIFAAGFGWAYRRARQTSS